ncbi:DUF4412 domain-containing protein [Hyunsoonleella flava]|uniref:DUF4412 domain-containing protein n=1 Tax=Hyunsoonleella flava TaxID=2527939 RepID=A0A4Q9FLQ3_9FLAO|nr:DUF4412 domain-containing protein [Hyunsoonleella flava]TBN06707.1 DUF4412 domain-containing protein [Hyunsoonleella flava]
MKLKQILLLIMCLGVISTSEAQLLKKLKKKAERAIERTVLKKADSLVAKKTEKAIDSMAKGDSKKNKRNKNNKRNRKTTSEDEKAQGILDIMLSQTPKEVGGGKENNDNTTAGKPLLPPEDNNVKLPDSYKFSYQATIQVKSNNKTAEVEYLLQPNETYYAKKQTKNGFTEHIVYDNERSIEVYYAEIEGQKRQARKKMGILTKARLLGAYKDAPDKQVKPLGSKKLLGFNCEGYEISTQDGTTQFWVTNEAPATLYAVMFESRAEAPNSPFTKNSMIMEVAYTSKESPNENYQMACTQLQPKTMVFNKTDYIE